MTRKEMTARRYAELFSIGEAALDLFRKMYIDVDYSLNHIKFRPDHLLAIAASNSINGIEAFINHIGFIFDNEWSKFQRKNFFDQYKRVITILNSIEINTNEMEISESPYGDFEKYRESIRNTFSHVHSSTHDIKIHHKKKIDDRETDFKETHEMINSWINISSDEAFDIYEKSEQFVISIRSEFQKKFFQSFQLAQILHRSGYFDQLKIDDVLRDTSIIPSYDKRQSLLSRFMRDALNPVAVVSGNYIPV